MSSQTDGHDQSWFEDTRSFASLASPMPETHRLWLGFMTARLTVAAVLVVVQTALYLASPPHGITLLLMCVVYLAATLASRFMLQPQPLGGAINPLWVFLIGVDILVFSALQVVQNPGINYTPLFALPILFASILGTLALGLGTAAGVTLLLLGGTYWNSLQSLTDATPYLVQAALSGAGYFAVAFLAHQLALRLVSESERARQGQHAATMQKRVNELVIESLPEGVVIVDQRGWVLAANPAARDMLDWDHPSSQIQDLKSRPTWTAIAQLSRTSLGIGQPLEELVRLERRDRSARLLRVRTRLAQPMGRDSASLCVLFLQDQRELEARLRTEKLASMGRMSAAVAHEIRNPLAAITQANALLSEDLHDPRLTRLTSMVEQNARRLGKIVDDILDVIRVQPNGSALTSSAGPLPTVSVAQFVAEWAEQSPLPFALKVDQIGADDALRFDGDHLRRIIFNLLDNARRYASGGSGSIRVWLDNTQESGPNIGIWSDGEPLDSSVQQHLFEPFFSSESRSSGLGLFICRELCARHGAHIGYRRMPCPVLQQGIPGNAFILVAQRYTNIEHHLGPTLATPWQTTLY